MQPSAPDNSLPGSDVEQLIVKRRSALSPLSAFGKRLPQTVLFSVMFMMLSFCAL
jgi:hypothetical protein